MEEVQTDRLRSKAVLLLNGSYEPLNLCTVRRGVELLFLGKAELLHSYPGRPLRSERTSFPRPSVIRLKYYVKVHRNGIPLTKRNILRRDNYTCQYCGRKGEDMTIDHVIPRSHGGEDSWENLVCACSECNARKGERTPGQAGMKLLRKPHRPSHIQLLVAEVKDPDPNWKSYLFL